MKELSIEEKAKRYDEAIERAKGVIEQNPLMEYLKKGIEYIFPELKESENEKIRKEIINYFKCQSRDEPSRKDIHNKWIAWLEKQEQKPADSPDTLIEESYQQQADDLIEEFEKQGDQKPTGKVKPKFKVGDWVVYDHRVYQVVGLPKKDYINLGLRRNGKTEFAPSTYCKLWTIQDAKDGDVLATKAGGIFIYKELLYDKPFAYCGVDKFGVFKDCNCGKGSDWTPYLSDVTPATKEQRNLLFQKMHEAGYEWDAEKKELKKIEQKPAWSEEDDKRFSVVIAEFAKCAGKSVSKDEWMRCNDWLYSLKDKVQLKHEWSEDDSVMIDNILGTYKTLEDMLDLTTCQDKDILESMNFERDWIKSLKYRIQPKQEWSEKDKEMIEALNMYIKQLDVMFSEIKIGDKDVLAKDFRENVQNWLKSLKDRVQPQPKQEWNEEDKKMIIKICQNLYDYPRIKSPFDNESFNEAQKEVQFIESLCYQSHWKPSEEQMKALEDVIENNIYHPLLEELLEQLKKLREE